MSSYDRQTAAERALGFIKRQMNSANFTHTLSFAQKYDETYAGGMMWCKVSGFGADDARRQPEFIAVDRFCEPEYSGVVSGTWHGLDDYTQYAVDVYEVTDRAYLICSCPLRSDGTWQTERLVKTVEIYDAEIVTYYTTESVGVNAGGFKDVRLVRKNWEDVPVFDIPDIKIEPNDTGAQNGASTTVLQPQAVSDEIIERPYATYKDYSGKFYTYTDAEYLNASCEVFDAGEFAFFFCANSFEGRKIAKLVHESGEKYTVVGICGATNIQDGRFPASFMIPEDDPQYNRDGSKARNLYGYMLNSRCFIYDAGLALITFTISGDYDLCIEMMNRLRAEQNEDGSFNFSYDNYIGQLFEGYVRTGAIGWLVHGMCYYALKTGDMQFADVIRRAGDWLLTRQITDKQDRRYGLLTGGYGSYDPENYSYIEGEIEWCSTEHNCSALQAVAELALVLGDEKYKKAAAMIKQTLFTTLYDKENARFYQGAGKDGVDDAWALDCCTWAGKMLLSVTEATHSWEIAQTVRDVYAVSGKDITVSREQEHYNTRYSGGTFDGMRPYASGYSDPPEIVWSEGTLGYVGLLYAIGEREEADRYLGEMMKLQNCSGSTGGVLYVTETWARLPWEFHAWESVVSSAWLYILLKEPDALFPIAAKRIDQLTVGRDGAVREYAAVRAIE